MVLGQNGGTLAVPAIVGMILDSAGYGAAAMTMGALSLAACAICLLVFRRIYNKSIRSIPFLIPARNNIFSFSYLIVSIIQSK